MEVTQIHAAMHVAGICNGSEGKFSNKFQTIMERSCISEIFQSAWGKHEKEFGFDYIFCCFFDANDQVFPNDDPCQLGVMCNLAALHNAATLGCKKIQLNDRTNLECMFCPHCGYFANNAPTMNTHVWKHYRVGLFCEDSTCNFITNWVKVMLQHGLLFHGYGKKNKGTPIKSK